MAWEDDVDNIVEKLHKIYGTEFRGKKKGRFAITREQMKQAVKVKRLHQTTIEKIQERALMFDLLVIDLDDVFPIIKADIMRKYRRPSQDLFNSFFPKEEEVMEDDSDDE